MDNENQAENQGDNTETQALDEKTLLKQRAKMLGIDFGNNISVETLKAKIEEKLSGVEAKVAAEVNPLGSMDDSEEDLSKLTPEQRMMRLRKKIREEQLKLVRLRVTCMDPKKSDLPGEIFTIANEYLGTVAKFVPFGEPTDNGYHVPFCIYTMMNERKFLNIRTRKDRKTGQTIVEHQWAKEFALEVLPQMTPEELKQLATAQIAAGSLDAPAQA